MKCFVLKNGEIIPACKVLDFKKTFDKTIVKYQKFLTLAGTIRKMICYDESIKYRDMTEEEEEEFGIKGSEK